MLSDWSELVLFFLSAVGMKVGYFYKNANIKLVDAGTRRMPDMFDKDEHKLGLLRRCDMFVHVVRCFDLEKPRAPAPPDGDTAEDDGGNEEQAQARDEVEDDADEVEDDTDNDSDEMDWPRAATPLEDVKRAVGDMAYADLQFIQQRRK